ncbi:MAG: AMP-binding protein [Bacteroidales bacterium]|nr:AMP-binding protein [Candidatus Scybalocola fimicaballi]
MNTITIDNKTYIRENLNEIENQNVRDFLIEWFSDSPTVNLHTSGSTGVPKLIVAEKSRMVASAKMTLDYLKLKPGDTALLCLSVNYIAGKMMIVRAIVGGLNLLIGDVSSNPLQNEERHIDFAAMVPLQVYNSYRDKSGRFSKIGKIIIGGGAIDRREEEVYSSAPNEIYATYGMTETLSHIAMRRINGVNRSDYFTPMENVEVNVNVNVDHNVGPLVIKAPHLCAETLYTNDNVEMRPDHTFRILGRKDNVVCSGGIKLQIEEIEAKLSNYIHADFAVSSKPDEKLGEKLVLVIEGEEGSLTLKPASTLSKYEIPKEVFYVQHLPRTESGKIARAKVKEMLNAKC